MVALAPVYAPVRNLMLYLTEECNLRCSYCFVDKKPRYMSEEVARWAVEFFYSRNISGGEYQVHLNFFGGESFLCIERMHQVIAMARERRPNVYKQAIFSATTNGTVATPEVERLI